MAANGASIESGFGFPNRFVKRRFGFRGRSGGVWSGRNCLAKEFADVKTLAGITTPKAGFQWLRHSFSTEASQGGDLPAVQLAMGHADRTITLTFIKFTIRVYSLSRHWLKIGLSESELKNEQVATKQQARNQSAKRKTIGN